MLSGCRFRVCEQDMETKFLIQHRVQTCHLICSDVITTLNAMNVCCLWYESRHIQQVVQDIAVDRVGDNLLVLNRCCPGLS